MAEVRAEARPTNRALSRPNPIKQLLDRILDVVGAEAEAAHSAYEGCGAGDGESDEVAFVGARVDDHAGFDSCEGSAFVLGDAELGFDDGVGVESGVDGLEQGFEAFAGEGGERDLGTFTVGSGAGAGALLPFGLEFVRESRAARSSSGSRSILLSTSMRGLERHSSSPRTFST